MGVGGLSLTPLPVLGTLSFLVGCLIQFWYEGMCLILTPYAILALYPQEACSFLNGNRGGVDLGEKGVLEKGLGG